MEIYIHTHTYMIGGVKRYIFSLDLSFEIESPMTKL